MKILEILKQKQEELMEGGSPLSINFTVAEINTLSDKAQLRALKMICDFPEDFKKSSDIFSCTKAIIRGDSIYRVLEFCMLMNRVLYPSITSVFAKMGE